MSAKHHEHCDDHCDDHESRSQRELNHALTDLAKAGTKYLEAITPKGQLVFGHGTITKKNKK